MKKYSQPLITWFLIKGVLSEGHECRSRTPFAYCTRTITRTRLQLYHSVTLLFATLVREFQREIVRLSRLDVEFQPGSFSVRVMRRNRHNGTFLFRSR